MPAIMKITSRAQSIPRWGGDKLEIADQEKKKDKDNDQDVDEEYKDKNED